MKYVPPSVNETAFSCPHCGALTTQHWYSGHVEKMEKNELPLIITLEKLENLTFDHIDESGEPDRLKLWAERKAIGLPFFDKGDNYNIPRVENLYISRCYNCEEVTIWVYDRMIYPMLGEAPPANPDMPSDIRRDYDEASTILDLSPRGAAALIRFAIDRLCKQLGKPENSINENIKILVANGLDTRVQKALDAVRVIGNNAVHPKELDLRDDRATAESLFRLLNIIVEKMISEEKQVDEVFAMLPEGARQAIAKRDGKGD